MSGPTIREYFFLLRCCLMSFIHRAFLELNPQTPFLPNWHIELIAAKLEQVAEGKIRRLIIALPPRNIKSHAVSVAFVAWYLGRFPSRHVIAASYGQDLATKFAQDCRRLMDSRWYRQVFRTRLANRAVDDFITTEGGSRMATSVGGVLTGRGADLIVIDDPLKPDEALSETRRKAVNDWFDNSLLSRLNDKKNGAIVIVMQRLHQDDLIGHVLEQEAWEMVSLPAIAEEDQTLVIENAFGRRTIRREAGDVLHPERESLETLATIKANIGEYNFASQYQQTPVPLEGAWLKREWLRFYEPQNVPVRFSRVLQSWDTASKTSELNDFSVCTTWGMSNRDFFLLDVYRKRVAYPDLRKAAVELKKRYRFAEVLVEDKSSGTQLIQDLKASGVTPVVGWEPLPHTDKYMRFYSKTILFESGQVWFPKEAPWLQDYLKELLAFPGTKFDDQVDSTTQALDYLQSKNAVIDQWLRLFPRN